MVKITNIRDLSREAQIAFALFLKAEIKRHHEDILNAELDLEVLRDLGVDVEGMDDYGFVRCRE